MLSLEGQKQRYVLNSLLVPTSIEIFLILERVGTSLTPRLTQRRANRFHLVVKETPHQSHPKPQPADDEKCVYCGGGGGGGRVGKRLAVQTPVWCY